MTAPIPQGQPRQRPARSCVPCRSCKVRCKGAEKAERTLVDGFAREKCERCAKLGLDCEFVPLKRKGRPRRLPKGATAPVADEFDSPPSEHNNIYASSSKSASTSSVSTTRAHPYHVPPSNASSTSSPAPYYPQVPPPPPQNGALVRVKGGSQTLYDFDRFASSRSPTPSNAPFSLQDCRSPFPMPFCMTPPFELPTSSQALSVGSPRSQHLDNIAQGYIAVVHSFLPILPPIYDHLTEYLKSATPLLSLAISTILTAHSDINLNVNVFGSTLQDVQAALIFSYWAYGKGDLNDTLRYFKFVTDKILEYGWHRLDEPGRHLAHLAEADKEMIRSLFWESWCSEVTLASLSGSNKLRLHDVQQSIFQPQAARSDRCYGPSPFSLKIRCYAVLGNIVKNMADGFSPDEAVGVTDLFKNIGTLAYQSYVASTDALAKTKTPTEYAIASADCEAAFMAGLSSSAGGVFVPSLPMFVADAFVCGHDTTKQAPETMYKPMRAAARQAFQLCQASLAPTSSPIVHSPFFTCALFVSAQGLITTLRDDPSCQADNSLSAASTFSELELGEFVLDKGCEQWTGARKILDEIQMLRLSIAPVEEAISSRLVRPGTTQNTSSTPGSSASSNAGHSSPGASMRLVNPVIALQNRFQKAPSSSSSSSTAQPIQTIAPSALSNV